MLLGLFFSFYLSCVITQLIMMINHHVWLFQAGNFIAEHISMRL